MNADLDVDKFDVLYWWYDEHGVNDNRLLVDDRFDFSLSSVCACACFCRNFRPNFVSSMSSFIENMGTILSLFVLLFLSYFLCK